MFYIVAYDLPDTKRRTRLFKAMKGFGTHTQYSVFECELDEDEHAKMLRTIRRIVDESEDDVKIYRLCHACLRTVEVVGVGRTAIEPECIVI
jgi:CRISPR-associated protein Cas2